MYWHRTDIKQFQQCFTGGGTRNVRRTDFCGQGWILSTAQTDIEGETASSDQHTARGTDIDW